MTKTLYTHVDIEIPRPAEEVWAVVTDYATDTVWRKGITEMTPDRDGSPEVGTNVREVLNLGGREYVTDTAVTEVGPGMSERVFERANQHHGALRSLVHQSRTLDDLVHSAMVHQ